MMEVRSKKDAAAMLRVAESSLADRRYLARIGLPVVRVGRRVLFDVRDIERLLERGREELPFRQEGV
jgi:hypothetical protein